MNYITIRWKLKCIMGNAPCVNSTTAACETQQISYAAITHTQWGPGVRKASSQNYRSIVQSYWMRAESTCMCLGGHRSPFQSPHFGAGWSTVAPLWPATCTASCRDVWNTYLRTHREYERYKWCLIKAMSRYSSWWWWCWFRIDYSPSCLQFPMMKYIQISVLSEGNKKNVQWCFVLILEHRLNLSFSWWSLPLTGHGLCLLFGSSLLVFCGCW